MFYAIENFVISALEKETSTRMHNKVITSGLHPPLLFKITINRELFFSSIDVPPTMFIKKETE